MTRPTAPPRTGMSERLTYGQVLALEWLSAWTNFVTWRALSVAGKKQLEARGLVESRWNGPAQATEWRITESGRAALARASVVGSSAGEGGSGR